MVPESCFKLVQVECGSRSIRGDLDLHDGARIGTVAGQNWGLHWHLPFPIESVTKVNVEDIRDIPIGYRSGGEGGKAARRIPQEALMLTQDENIIDIQFAVQYKIKDAKDYLFNVRDPDATLQQSTESAIREVVGKSKMDFALKEGRAEIAARYPRGGAARSRGTAQ